MQITDKIQITNEDNMNLMKRFSDNYFDLAIVDPPYGIGEDGSNTHGRLIKKDGSFIKKIDKRSGREIKVKPKNYISKKWDENPPNKEYFNELIRVSKHQIIWGSNHFIENLPIKNSSCWIVWDKINGETDFADCELAWTSFKTAVRQIRFMWNGYNQSQSLSEPELRHGNHALKEKRIHPTQKPVDLYKWILDKYAKQWDKILDTHLGSMSIAIACHDLGFELTGCELDKDYYDKGIERVKNYVSQLSLFKPEELIK